MMKQLQRYRQVISCLSPPVQAVLSAREARLAPTLREIRLRAERPLSVVTGTGRFFFTQTGMITPFYTDSVFCTTREDVQQTLQTICDYSIYSRQQEIVSGYVTLKGGHRAGLCGTAVLSDGKITNIRELCSLNLRMAGEYIGCADALFQQIRDLRGGLILCGAPCSGKTTLLRDLARQLSLEASVSLIDERGELAASIQGVPQNDVGLCDVYSGYPKASAMEQAIRAMSPEYLICDELGGNDIQAIRECVRSGVAVIATVHARDADELKTRRALRELLETGAFEKAAFLTGSEQVGRVRECVGVGDMLAA